MKVILRNFLIPQNKVIVYSKANALILEQKKKSIETRKEEKRKNALSLKEKIDAETIEIEMAAGDKGKLFGAVTTAMMAEELEKKGLVVEKKKIDIPETIKTLGNYKVRVKLYGGETAEFSLVVKAVEKTEE